MKAWRRGQGVPDVLANHERKNMRTAEKKLKQTKKQFLGDSAYFPVVGPDLGKKKKKN